MADRVTVAEAAAILGVSEDVVRKRLQRGTLAGEKQGRTWLVTLQEEVQFLRERLEEKDAVISRLSEAQVEALRRRDILAAQGREALPKPVASRAWWQFWR